MDDLLREFLTETSENLAVLDTELKHVIFGQVTQGLDVARKLVVTDRLERVTVK